MKEEKQLLEVVAALIRDKDKFLICQRPANKARGLLWEFVGGKVEMGETKEEALIRECEEELKILIEPREVFATVTHEYFDVIVSLTVFNCGILRGQPQLTEHNALAWIAANESDGYNFCPADVEILEKLKTVKM